MAGCLRIGPSSPSISSLSLHPKNVSKISLVNKTFNSPNNNQPSSASSIVCRASATLDPTPTASPVTIAVKNFRDGTTKDSDGSKVLDIATAGENARGLVHRYVVHVRQNMRRGTASTKTRSEVRGGGKKPYAQKGTGRARQGSRRTPLRPGGGVIFGPKPRDWSSKMNKKEKWLALSSALMNAAAGGSEKSDATSQTMFVLESLENQFAEDKSDVKTKVMEAKMRSLGVEEGESALIIGKDNIPDDVTRSGRNLPWLNFNTVARGIHITDVLQADKIFFSMDAFEYVSNRFGDGSGNDDDVVAEDEEVEEGTTEDVAGEEEEGNSEEQ